jgi:8-oxo-dGTP diphosphatase
VMSAAHIDAVPEGVLTEAVTGRDDLLLSPIVHSRRPHPLPFDHDGIVDLAVRDLRERYARAPDPAHLAREPFTLRDLRRTHEAVMGEPLQKDTFRRQMEPSLQDTGRLSDGMVGRPARLFRHRAGGREA